MKCPFCGKKTKVIDKRDSGDSVTRRRRECKKCKRRFTTYERPDIEITIIKKDGKREKYSREKLLVGLKKACEKRPIPIDKIEKIIDKIEEKLRKRGKEVKSKIIGKEVIKKLKKLDKIAYIRFASVYREFKDLKDFKNEMENLK